MMRNTILQARMYQEVTKRETEVDPIESAHLTLIGAQEWPQALRIIIAADEEYHVAADRIDCEDAIRPETERWLKPSSPTTNLYSYIWEQLNYYEMRAVCFAAILWNKPVEIVGNIHAQKEREAGVFGCGYVHDAKSIYEKLCLPKYWEALNGLSEYKSQRRLRTR